MYRLDITLSASHTETPHRFTTDQTIDGLTADELRALVGSIENAVMAFFAARPAE